VGERTKSKPLIVVVGETGSGKSALSMKLARKFNGEIICADSRTVYKGMDIGTAKPSEQDQRKIKHHVLDVVMPDQHFTAADFKRLANETIADIHGRGKLPIMVGGTGLYIDSVIFDYDFRPPADPERRTELEKLDVPQLQAQLEAEGIALPANDKNPRHLVRALETGGVPSNKQALLPWTLVIGLNLERAALKERLTQRVHQMIDKGLEDEVKQLTDKYGWEIEAMSAVGYREWRDYFGNQQTLAETQELIIKNSLAYAKKQRTWFKRNKSIQWVSDPSKYVDIVTTFLNNLQ
jgi:tRNA dimethylallyltransferase